MSKYTNMAAAAAVALGLSFGTAQAVTTKIFVSGTDIFVECSDTTDPVCQGFTGAGSPGFPTGAGTLMDDTADMYSLADSSLATETEALNTLISGDDSTPYTTGVKSGDLNSEGQVTFETTAAHLAFKIGDSQHTPGDYFFLALLSPGIVEVLFDQNNQEGGGLSHYTEFGTSVVPLPAGLVLFLTGLAGVGFLGRYKVKRGVPTA